MQKPLKRLALAVLLSAPLLAGTLTVVQPNGGETFTLGETKTIRWTAADVSQNVRINLVRGSEVVGTIVSGLAPGSGHYLWKVGQLTDGTAPAGGNYFIRVRAIDSTESDQSDGPFSISVAHMPEGKLSPTLKVEQPNGGESVRLGDEHTIRWSSRFLQGKVHLQLYRNEGAGVGTIADDQPANGSYSWKAGEILGGMTVAGQYKIRAVAKDNHTVNDMSDGPFELRARLADVVGPDHPDILKTFSLPGVFLNFSGTDCFPGYAHSQIPASVYQEALAAFNTAACRAAGANTTAIAGIHWVTMSDPRFKAAAVYRSRIHFNLQEFAGKGAQLSSAKLKMKRIHAIDEDAGCAAPCACAEHVAVLKAVMTSFEIPASVGQSFPLPIGQAEFTLDVTDVVKGWLDGTLANHGLLLWTNEGVCSNCDRLCVSCYEAGLVLKMDQ